MVSKIEGPDPIAIIGMSVRAPGVTTIEEFWTNLVEGKDFLTRQVERTGKRTFITVDSEVPNWDCFDSDLFRYSNTECSLIDPQQRMMLEMAWEAFEDASIDAKRCTRNVGIFAATAFSQYHLRLIADETLSSNAGLSLLAAYGCLPEHAAMRIAYKLNLQGPALSINTACSSGLVAVIQAVETLRAGRCDMAIAGAVSLSFRKRYEHIEGGVHSADGYCRPFDRSSTGTVFGQGGAVFLLKPLADAVRDGDPVYAAIGAVVINNDGSRKVGYTAPGTDGQRDAIAKLLREVSGGADAVQFVEAHGTGTQVGDPIELTALTEAFRGCTSRVRSCTLGSIKSNMGHIGVASGAIGLAKGALAARHSTIPPTIHFSQPNPLADLDNSPFFVNTAPLDWPVGDGAADHAIICALGIGGTNAYAAIKRVHAASGSRRTSPPQWWTVPVSAATQAAATEVVGRLCRHLVAHPEIDSQDVACTYQTGRSRLPERAAVLLGPDKDHEVLRLPEKRRSGRPVVAFAFTGQGGGFGAAASALMHQVSEVGSRVRDCGAYFNSRYDIDVLPMIHGGEAAGEGVDTRLAQASLFAFEFSIAATLIDWDVKPKLLVGHSVGELVALCISGALPLHAAMDLIARRAGLMHATPRGAMLAVAMDLTTWNSSRRAGIAVAAVNGTQSIVLSGCPEKISKLATEFAKRGIMAKQLMTAHAFHSETQQQAAAEFADFASSLPFGKMELPVVSTVRPGRLTAADLQSTDYWRDSIAGTVHFHSACCKIVDSGPTLFVEVGPTPTLTNIIRASVATGDLPSDTTATAMMRERSHYHDRDLARLLGWGWNYGLEPQFAAVKSMSDARRIRMPTYPFQRKRYFHEANEDAPARSSDTPSTPAMAKQGAAAMEEVVGVFSRVLGYLPSPSDYDRSFFELGGDSMASIALTQGLATLGHLIPMTAFLSNPTVTGVAAFLQQQQREIVERSAPIDLSTALVER